MLEILKALSLIELVQLLKDISTILAIFIGGIWSYRLFVIKRQRYPKIEIKHIFDTYEISNDKLLLVISNQIKNIGETAIRIKEGELRLLQILPLEEDIEIALGENKNIRRLLIEKIADRQDEWPQNIIPWPQIGFFDHKHLRVIEPGNTGVLVFDFIIEKKIKLVRVDSFIKNELLLRRTNFFANLFGKKRSVAFGWMHSSTHSIPENKSNKNCKLKELCQD